MNTRMLKLAWKVYRGKAVAFDPETVTEVEFLYGHGSGSQARVTFTGGGAVHAAVDALAALRRGGR